MMRYLAILLLLSSCHMSKDISLWQMGDERFSVHTLNVEGYETPLRYVLIMPTSYDGERNYPLLLFLHGAGERGENIEDVYMHGPPAMAREGKLQNYIILAPQCPEDEYWDNHEQITKLKTLINQYATAEGVERKRVYLTGLSMGGYGTWRLAGAIPEIIAAAVPICGGGSITDARRMKDVPTWVFHGTEDNVVPFSESEKMVTAMKSTGAEPIFTILEGVGHNAWTPAYSDPKLWKWLSTQSLKPSESY